MLGGGLRGEVGGWEEGAGHGANGGLFSNLVPLDFGGFGFLSIAQRFWQRMRLEISSKILSIPYLG